MHDLIIQYVVVLCLLVPLADVDSAKVLLLLIGSFLLVTLLWEYTPLTIYICVCIGEVLNIYSYTLLKNDNKVVVLTVLSLWSFLLSFMVWIDPYNNLLHTHYELLNIALLEASVLILTFKIGADSPFKAILNKAS